MPEDTGELLAHIAERDTALAVVLLLVAFVCGYLVAVNV